MNASSVAMAGALSFSESKITALQDVTAPEEVGVVLSLSSSARGSQTPFSGQSLPSFESGTASLSRTLKAPTFVENETL